MGLETLTLSRRRLLQGGAGLVIALQLPLGAAKARAGTAAAPFAPNAFVRVGTDNIVTVTVKHIEFGQGPLTGLAVPVAEEMDADWAQMRGELAPSNTELYKNFFFGIQGTGGSSGMANSYEQMRQAGAAARTMLVAAAAKAWAVPAQEITVERGVLRHASGREGRFGDFAQAAAGLPVPENVVLKDPSRFRLIGKDGAAKRLDSAAKSQGTATFTIDIQESDMLTVVVARPPRFGAKLARFDAAEALAVKGVTDVKAISSGVAVYGQGTWPAIKGRSKLKIEWDESGAETRGSAQMVEEYRQLAQKPGLTAAARGDVDGALAQAERVIEAEYVFPYLAHAPMEPLDGFIHFDGESARVKFGTQIQTLDHGTIAGVLGLAPEKITLETMLAGGSFGRRAQNKPHFAVELAEIAKAMPGRPLKLLWTREDDITGGYYRPLAVHRLRAGLTGGKIVAWSNTCVLQSIMIGSPMEAMTVKDGVDETSVEGSNETPYALENFRCDLHSVTSPVPVLWWRSVGHTHTGFAVECFIDELLQATGRDPVEGRLALMGAAPRESGVLRAVAAAAGWSGPGPVEGRARGVAVVKSFGSYVAQIVEASLKEDGTPRVHKVWCAVDCGVAVVPDIVRAQMEGCIGYGLGHALYAAVPLEAGRPTVRNFDTYRSLRIHEMPQIEVVIVPSTQAPSGVGEPGLPPLAPALANALARLKSDRIRHLPMVGGIV